MQEFQPMSGAEEQVMEVLWSAAEPQTSAEIIRQLGSHTQWKPSTVWTFLGRLAEKGFLLVEKQGKRSLYRPAISQPEYRRLQTQRFLKNVHQGSVKSFFAALSGGSVLSQSDLQELREWLNNETGDE